MNPDIDPVGSNAFVALVHWLDATLLGSLASVVAVIAVGWVGLLLISGRMEVQRAVQVIMGCFIIFGASTIAAGIIGALGRDGSVQPQASPVPPPLYPTAPPEPLRTNSPYDPYAGAALPPRR